MVLVQPVFKIMFNSMFTFVFKKIVFAVCAMFILNSATVLARAIYETPMNNTPVMPTDAVPKDMQGVTITEHLGEKLNLDLKFKNQDGHDVTIRDLLKNGKPIILSLNYYRCTTLCGVQLQNLAQTLKDLAWPIGKDFTVATVSFDATDTSALAKEKQKEFLEMANDPDGEWNFLTGTQLNIDQLTKAIGFYYNYIPERNEFAHTAAIFFISPEGIISRYLYGISYKTNDVKFALMETAMEKIGTTTDKFLLFCCNYNPTLGRYTGLAVGLMRVGGIATMIFIGSLIFYHSRRRRRAVS